MTDPVTALSDPSSSAPQRPGPWGRQGGCDVAALTPAEHSLWRHLLMYFAALLFLGALPR